MARILPLVLALGIMQKGEKLDDPVIRTRQPGQVHPMPVYAPPVRRAMDPFQIDPELPANLDQKLGCHQWMGGHGYLVWRVWDRCRQSIAAYMHILPLGTLSLRPKVGLCTSRVPWLHHYEMAGVDGSALGA